MPQREKRSNFFLRAVLLLTVCFCYPAGAKVVRVTGSEFTHRCVTERQLRAQVEFLSDSLCDGRILIGIGSYDLARGYSAEYADGRHHCGTDSQQQIFFHIFLQSAAASSVCGLIYCYI